MTVDYSFSPATGELIDLAIREDLYGGDVTSDAIFASGERSEGSFVAKQELVLCGAALVNEVYRRVDSSLEIEWLHEDGAHVTRGALANSRGPARSLLRAERVALNFLRHLSGIATMTRQYVEALGEGGPLLLDTRKTTPGFRELEKYAVKCGGGRNHRFNLGSGAMIKDNHIEAAGSLSAAVKRVREQLPWLLKLEVEVKDLAELQEAIDAGVDVVLLDNMSTATMREAVELAKGRVLLEASGNITIERLPELRDIGLNAVSSGAITHSAPNADISYLFGKLAAAAKDA